MSEKTRMAGDKLKEYEAYFSNEDPSRKQWTRNGGTLSPTTNVNQQNPVKTDIEGNRNTVTNNQDNSVSQYTIDNSNNSRAYGGSSRYFAYRGGDGESRLYDSPTSMATLGGYFDTDDSPAANAKFHDMYTTLNSDYQKAHRKDVQTKGSGTFDHNSDTSRSINPAKFYEYIRESPGRSFQQSDKLMKRMYGDVGSFALPGWKMPEPGEPIEWGQGNKDKDNDKDED